MHTFVLGPSGTGKSHLSAELAKKDDLLFIEADLWPPRDGMVCLGLKAQWDTFYERFDPAPLRSELDARATIGRKSGVVLSFPGFPLLNPGHIEASRGTFRIVYLEGSPNQCRNSFLERERTGRQLPKEYWDTHIGNFFNFLASGEVAANTISTFAPDGTRRPLEHIYEELQRII